jgi:hypothetical protein
MKHERLVTIEIFSACRQFYIQDETTEDYPDWTTEAAKRLLAVGNATVGVGTVR